MTELKKIGFGKRNPHQKISHTLLGITPEEIHERIRRVLASFFPFSSFLFSIKSLAYFLYVKADWDHLRPQYYP